jgi:NADPH-dependent F420 reductase
MKIGILGGTGKEGAGLALRLSRSGSNVVIGSRDAARAAEKSAELSRQSGGDVRGGTNREAAAHGEIVIAAVPFSGHRSLLASLADALEGKVLVDTVVPLDFTARRPYAPPAEGSAAEEALAVLGARVHVVAALHQIAAHELSSLDHAIEADGLYCGDDAGAKARVADLIRALGIRAIDAGPLRNASILEALTPLLIDINKRNKVKGAGIRITGI